jgi:hypothetical protein
MRFGRALPLLLIAGATLLLATACGDARDGGGGGGIATPSPTPGAGRTVVPAPIDKLELITRESAPPQYAVRILSGLPSGCARFNEARITGRSGTTITIDVTNTMPADNTIACTAIYGTHEAIIELGTDFIPGTEYLVRVNDKELRFTAQ